MKRLMFVLAALLAMFGAVQVAAAKDYPPVHAPAGVAIGGHDPVAYFTEGRPVEGAATFETQWNGATWRFASAANKAMFEADPAAYAPQFGGYCAWAASQGYIAPGDPLQWRIVDGELFLNYNARAKALWEQDMTAAITRGKANWPRILTDNQD